MRQKKDTVIKAGIVPSEDSTLVEEEVKSENVPSEEAPAVILPDDPGELVSLWFSLKKEYEELRSEFKGKEDRLNRIGELLVSFSISVPRVGMVEAPPEIYSQTPAALPSQEAIVDGAATAWTPPPPRPVDNSKSTTISFSPPSNGGAEPEGAFAASIADNFERALGGLKF